MVERQKDSSFRTRHRNSSSPLWIGLLVIGLAMTVVAQTPATAFTYQGRLVDSGGAANGLYDFQFDLYDDAVAGNAVANTLTQTNIDVTGGVFTVLLDFGDGKFIGSARWLQIAVRRGSSSGSFTALSPRQLISSAPSALYAVKASNASQLNGQLPAFYLDLSTHTGNVGISQGGTGASSAAGARVNLGAAASGANSDITSLSGLTVPLSVAQGGTGGDSPASSAFQARISGSCSPGTTIRSINSDGTLVCVADGPRGGAVSLKLVDGTAAAADSGGNAITVGSDGLGLIAYIDNGARLNVAHCLDVECAGATITTLDASGAVASITTGSDGLGLISYRGNSALKVAHCSDLACTSATITTLDTTPFVNRTAITIGSDGLGLILYEGDTSGKGKVAHCSNVACTSAVISTPVGVGYSDSGPYYRFASIAIGANGFADLAFTTSGLKIMHCDNLDCSEVTDAFITNVPSAFGASIATGVDGNAIVSYIDTGDTQGNVKVARCPGFHCSSPSVVTIDATASFQPHLALRNTSIAIGADGFPTVAYISFKNDPAGELKLAHCTTISCSSVVLQTLEFLSPNAQEWLVSLTLDNDGFPLMSYGIGGMLDDLKVARCSNDFCSPFVMRRR